MIGGQHLLIDAFNCNVEKINSRKFIRNFLKELVSKIDMEILATPKVYRAKEGQPDGITGFVIITTSHISIHTFIETKHFWIDVFSCKTFDKDKVINFVEKEFNCETKSSSVYRKIYKV